MKYKPQSEFPLLKEYGKVFTITSDTIFAFIDTIYTNNPLPDHLVVHEKVHLKRQNKVGVDIWVEQFLTDPKFRLNEERLAYLSQLRSIKDRENRFRLKVICARNLSSPLYGDICNFDEAMKLLHT